MQFVADLHLHSKYSRAVSPDMNLTVMSEYAKKKGIDILTTGDWTHPLWFREIKSQLEETSEGLYKLKDGNRDVHFILSCEISSIYSQGGKTRRIHNLVFTPNIEVAEKISYELVKRGCNLMSDGRPIIGLSAKDLLELILSVDKRAVLVPCHIWTPWFSLFGSNSGFDSIEECFGNYSKYIYAIETGLSSDPLMNWHIKDLEERSILSFSDSHSPAKMAREATVLELVSPTYKNIIRSFIHPFVLALVKSKEEDNEERLKNKVAFTIEFHPEEGKYHYTGHRNCKVVQSPEESRRDGVICKVCKRPLTVGVMQRVQDLAREFKMQSSKFKVDEYGVRWFEDPTNNHPPYVKLVPLLEIIAESLSSTVSSGKVKNMFDLLCETFGSEIKVLLKTKVSDIQKVAGERVAEGIDKVRKNEMALSAGFDGEYGKVKIWKEEEGKEVEKIVREQKKKEESQLGLF